jgi:hypothetical protein
MRHRRLALTGPAAAALHDLDGFRALSWPPLWCAPNTGDSGDRIVRTRLWEPPETVEGVLVCPLPLVIRHLNAVPTDLSDVVTDGLSPVDRVELAVENALRLDAAVLAGGGGAMAGDVVLAYCAR